MPFCALRPEDPLPYPDESAGQQDGEDASLPGIALHDDISLVELYDFSHQRQAETVSLHGMGGIPLIKFVENTADRRIVHPGTFIFDGKQI